MLMETVEVRGLVRDSNVKIANVARETSFEALVPFICECGDPSCRGISLLSLGEFEAMRAKPAKFIIGEAHGHIPAAVVTPATWSPLARTVA
jgi:hypothetical protein